MLATVLLAAACSGGSGGSDPEVEGPFAGTEPAPEFPGGLDWFNTGREALQLSQLRGKVVALHFWSPGCIACINVLAELERLAGDFGDQLAVVGVSSPRFGAEAAPDTVRQAVLRLGIDDPAVNDAELAIWRQWGLEVQPTVALVDPAGNIVGARQGEGAYDALRPVVASLLDEFAGDLDSAPLVRALERDGLPETVLSFPGDVAVDAQASRAYIADTANHRIVVAALPGGDVVEVYGSGAAGFRDGTTRDAAFAHPQGVALSPDEAALYVADTGNHAVRSIDLATGRVGTVAGTGALGLLPPETGAAPVVALRSPWDVVVGDGTLYVAMAGSNQLWSIDPGSGRAEPIAGTGAEGIADGDADDAELSRPGGLALDGGGRLYFADPASSTVRGLDLGGGVVSTIAGPTSGLFVTGDVDGAGEAVRLQLPLGLAFDGDRLLVADTYNHKVKSVAVDTGTVTTLLGGSSGWADGSDPRFSAPGGIDVAGTTLYVADTNNHALRLVDLESGTAETLVLKGIEGFQPTADDEGYRGTRVELPALDVAAGAGTVVLDITLPPDHKVNEEAPSRVGWIVDGGMVGFAADLDTSLTGATFPVAYPVTLTEGEGRLVADLDLFWCANDAESLCFIEQLRLAVPVRVGSGSATEIVVPYEISLPEIP